MSERNPGICERKDKPCPSCGMCTACDECQCESQPVDVWTPIPGRPGYERCLHGDVRWIADSQPQQDAPMQKAKQVVANADFGEGWYDYDVVEAEEYEKVWAALTQAREALLEGWNRPGDTFETGHDWAQFMRGKIGIALAATQPGKLEPCPECGERDIPTCCGYANCPRLATHRQA